MLSLIISEDLTFTIHHIARGRAVVDAFRSPHRLYGLRNAVVSCRSSSSVIGRHRRSSSSVVVVGCRRRSLSSVVVVSRRRRSSSVVIVSRRRRSSSSVVGRHRSSSSVVVIGCRSSVIVVCRSLSVASSVSHRRLVMVVISRQSSVVQ